MDLNAKLSVQDDSGKTLVVPVEVANSYRGLGYRIAAEDVEEFNRYQAAPTQEINASVSRQFESGNEK